MWQVSQSGNSYWNSLLANARQGDDEALGELWQQLRHYLLLTADRGLGRGLRAKLGASDIVQQSLLEAQRDFAGFTGDSEDELRAWLVKLVKHNLIDAGRRYGGTQQRDLTREVWIDVTNKQREIPGRDKTASSLMRRHERDEQLLRAVARLPERRRRIIELRHRRGLSFAQIGDELGISEVAARKLCSRAVEELRRSLSARYG